MIVAVAFSSGSHALGAIEFGIDEQDACAAVLDDVADLPRREPEVHRHQHPAVPRDTEEGSQQSGAVVRDEGDPLAHLDAKPVQVRGHGRSLGTELTVGELSHRGCRLVRLVDDAAEPA